MKTIGPLLGRLKKEGYTLVALEQSEKSIDYRSWQPSQGDLVALIVGNEVEGISKKTLEQCDAILELPMRGKKNSLNVSVAAGIALYHLSATIGKE